MSNKPDQDSHSIHSTLNGFRRENLLSCFSALCEHAPMTRADLAAITELSIMTTGKIADAMIECGVLIEEKHPGAGAGRRPGMLHFSPKPIFLILNLSSRRFRAHLLSPSKQFKEICVHDYNDIFPFDDNLLIFLNAVRRGCNATKENIPYLAVITAPEDDKRQSITRSLPISPRSNEHMIAYIGKIMRRECDFVVDEITAAQHYFHSISSYKDVDCGAFLCLSGMTYATVWMRGNLLSPRVCRIGELMMPAHRRISDALADAYCTKDAIEPTAYAISSLETFFTPDCVLIESDRFNIDEAFLQGVYASLSKLLPEDSRIIPLKRAKAEPSAAVCGCTNELRRIWFYDLTGIR